MRRSEEERTELLVRGFEQRFGRSPEIVARAPGRVNLIGEHTDYNGLPVLPMAIDRSVLVAGAGRDDQGVSLSNSDPQFPNHSYRMGARIRRFAAGDWGNYHKAAVQGLLRSLGPEVAHGGDFLVEGDIPPGAGLSSSSALVVASALALLAVNRRELAPRHLAELLAAAERYVGTQSGGMDQAVCLLASAGHALRIDFDPLRTRPVPLENGYVFVVCHSLEEARKSGAARRAYNHRVAECRLACRVLERGLGASLPRPLSHCGELRVLFPDRRLSDFVPILESILPPRPLRIAEVADIIGTSEQTLVAAVGPPPGRAATYSLLRRMRHVFTEAERVDRAESALESGDWIGLSALMDASHASCRDDYEVSSRALEETIAAAKQAGAIGARLTGAGFGGCTLNLVAAADVGLFTTMMERSFYRDRPEAHGREHCFVVTASPGASVRRL